MAAWLDLVKENEAWDLVDTNRLEQLVQELPNPKYQYPSLLYFYGNSNRKKALRALFPYNNITRKGPAGLIRLHLSTKTAHTQNPILFAESGLCLEQSLGDSKWLKNSTTKHQTFSLGGADGTLTPARLLYSKRSRGNSFCHGPRSCVYSSIPSLKSKPQQTYYSDHVDSSQLATKLFPLPRR
jgi:hypothetical protein